MEDEVNSIIKKISDDKFKLLVENAYNQNDELGILALMSTNPFSFFPIEGLRRKYLVEFVVSRMIKQEKEKSNKLLRLICSKFFIEPKELNFPIDFGNVICPSHFFLNARTCFW